MAGITFKKKTKTRKAWGAGGDPYFCLCQGGFSEKVRPCPLSDKSQSIFTKIRNKTLFCPLPPYLFNTVLEVLAKAVRQLTENKRVQTGQEPKVSTVRTK